eukprot:CAMPEP_0182912686 /NCGR_PEP_ID=MMETSP0034_2-20130328/37648_1 /TAXON_ID=156128 /ORGANISM="Nephroselmis pyriformis, Strain CCMP717" /LENGTH=39 /DNA_ID= /DNA_START= /DNA_END= /DNA_ORIENTATION=
MTSVELGRKKRAALLFRPTEIVKIAPGANASSPASGLMG